MNRSRHPRQRNGSPRRGAAIGSAVCAVLALIFEIARETSTSPDALSTMMVAVCVVMMMGFLIMVCVADR